VNVGRSESTSVRCCIIRALNKLFGLLPWFAKLKTG